MITRMYKGKLFGELSRTDTHVTGYRLDSNDSKPLGDVLVVPVDQVTLTGNDQFRLEVSAMTKEELLDLVMQNPEYLGDNYYDVLAEAIYERYNELKV